MRIMILAQHYAPEEVSGAVLATELAEDLVRRGHQVTFVTCAPNYPEGRVFAGYRNHFLARQTREGVQVVRVWSYISPNKGFWSRILNYGTFSLNALWGGYSAGKHDVIMSASPPLPLGLAAYLLSRSWKIPWLLRVEDLYPDTAVAAGVLKNRALIALFYWIERFVYKKATQISVISNGFKRALMNKDVPEAKITVLPVWADPELVKPADRENEFRKENNLCGAFVVMYAGNLGYTSAMEEVISAAESLKDIDDIRFVIIGEGVKKKELMDHAKAKCLENMIFLPFQPRNRFSEMLASADVGLVTLNTSSSHTSLPSKLFNIMSSERAVVAVADPNSDLSDVIRQANCGFVIPPGRSDLLANAILELKSNPDLAEQMGEKGRASLIEGYNRQMCVDGYESDFVKISSEQI